MYPLGGEVPAWEAMMCKDSPGAFMGGESVEEIQEVRRRLESLFEKLIRRAEHDTAIRSLLESFPKNELSLLARTDCRGRSYALMQLPSSVAELSSREREIALLVGDGLSNRVIAARLDISRATVAAYLRQVFKKLGVSSRVQLARSIIMMS
jgi:DNA-binding NarL/FixJ family response regulator